MQPVAERKPGEPVKWYRCPVSKDDLARLNRRSDFWAALQTLGFLSVLAATGTAAFYSAGHWPWPLTVALVYLHGTGWAFVNNGFHELLHDSVFKTRFLNRFFCAVFAFLCHHNIYWFWASHTEHHKFTLHPPDDQEVVLPQKFALKGYLQSAFINLHWRWWGLTWNARLINGRIDGKWNEHLFADNPREWRKAVNWARFLVFGHLAIVAVACYFRLWMLPLLITFAPYYGGGLQWLCNQVQHSGLCDNTPDFRLCVRTVYLNPVIQFLYWHMNYHTEHHMYAAVPCYNLGSLHRLIKPDMPPSPNGLYAAWKQVIEIQERQKQDPAYQYLAPLPQKGTQQSAAVKSPEIAVAV